MDYETISAMDDTEATQEHYLLTRQQVAILLGFLSPATWPTRWINLSISRDALEEKIANITHALMLPIEVSMIDDVRISSSGKLQKLVGGVWTDTEDGYGMYTQLSQAGDSLIGFKGITGSTVYNINSSPAFNDLAFENLLQGIAIDANSSAIVAINTAQGIQDGRLTALETGQGIQDGRLTALENEQTNILDDISTLQGQMANAQEDIIELIACCDDLQPLKEYFDTAGLWVHEFDFTGSSTEGWTLTIGTATSGGIETDSSTGDIQLSISAENQNIQFVRFVFDVGGTGITINARITPSGNYVYAQPENGLGSQIAVLFPSGADIGEGSDTYILVDSTDSDAVLLVSATFYGVIADPF